jgi:hypothetical protein
MSIVEKLTEGIVNRDLAKEGAALLDKWSQTGLLEGLQTDQDRANMARLLENQAKELLREASSMAGGDVEGFAAVAFPIVRRVFAGLIANDLVSVQPMSLPSGLIFFLDFTYNETRFGNTVDESVYGTDKVAKGIADGVSLSLANAEKGGYALNNGYSSPTGSVVVATTLRASGNVGAGGVADFITNTDGFSGTTGYDLESLLRYDADLVSGSIFAVASIPRATLATADVNLENYVALTITGSQLNSNNIQIRRLTREDPVDAANVLLIATSTTASSTPAQITAPATALNAVTHIDAPLADNFDNGGATGAIVGGIEWALENTEAIPEIDIKVDSLAITAVTKKLKAKWTPELGQVKSWKTL